MSNEICVDFKQHIYRWYAVGVYEIPTTQIIWNTWLKGAQYVSKFCFLCHLKNHHSKDVNSKFEFKWSSRMDVRSSFLICSCLLSYCVSLIMVTITGHFFIDILQTEHISAVKFDTGYEKNMSVLLMPKSLKVLKFFWKDRTELLIASFESSDIDFELYDTCMAV